MKYGNTVIRSITTYGYHRELQLDISRRALAMSFFFTLVEVGMSAPASVRSSTLGMMTMVAAVVNIVVKILQ